MPFVKGQSGNPGGRPSEARQELSALLDKVFTIAKRKKVIEKLIQDAEAGQHDARLLLLAYTYGKPIERQEISGPDGDVVPIQIIEFVKHDDQSDSNPGE